MKTSATSRTLPGLVLGCATLLALLPARTTAGDKEWATAGKILAGAAAVDVLSNHLPDRDGYRSRERGVRVISVQPVAVPYYGGPAAKYRDFAPLPPPLPETAPPQPQQQPALPPPRLIRITDAGMCSVDGKTVAPDDLKGALAGMPPETPLTVAAARNLEYQKVIAVLDMLKHLGFQNISLMAETPAAQAAPAAPAQPAPATPPAVPQPDRKSVV